MDDDFSDENFTDVGEAPVEEVEALRAKKNGSKIRGPDKSWIEVAKFSDASAFKNSEMATHLKTNFTTRKCRVFEYADIKEYECKFSRRVGYLPCPMKMKVQKSLCSYKPVAEITAIKTISFIFYYLFHLRLDL